MLRFALAVVTLSYRFSAQLLDQPISSLMIEGPFQRVTALQIEEAISDELGDGFFSADLEAIQEQIVALPWIDQATRCARWPGTLEITVTEQVPAAIWGERGLLNTRGDLFVRMPATCRLNCRGLSGPEGQSSTVAKRYLADAGTTDSEWS